MRILIANHIDEFLQWQADQRTFTQRVFWFAQNHDLVILSAPPDPCFVEYVTQALGVDLRTLRIRVTPPGRFAGKLFDPLALLDDEFVRAVAADLREADVTEIFPLFPTVGVARFAERLGLADRLPGAAFMAQGGGELANSKATFRAIAAAIGTPMAAGEVCRTIDAAEVALTRLLQTGAVMIKQAQNSAGVGNELVVLDDTLATDHAGAKHQRKLAREPGAVRAYLEERWEWASSKDRFPVVLEQFVPGCRTIFAEFIATDARLMHTECGALVYERRKLTAELAPLRDVVGAVRARLLEGGARLAEAYRTLGYRGYLSADAIVDADGNVTFTEMNARIGGSPHIYEGIGQRLVDVRRKPERTIIQYLTPSHWKVPSLERFLEVARELGCAWDPATRKGVVVAIPPMPDVAGGTFLFCVAFEADDEHRAILRALEARFA